jgi:multidrug efflux pump subunit AcrA (membrane-fusion protein)
MRSAPRIIIPLISLASLAFAIYAVAQAQRTEPPPPPVIQPPRSMFSGTIAGEGIVETLNEHTDAIGAPAAGLVLKVFVTVGDVVSARTPLFLMDDRPLVAQRLVQLAARDVTKATLDQMLAQPRPETIPPLEAQVAQTEAVAANWSAQVARLENAYTNGMAVSFDQLDQARWQQTAAVKAAELAKANLALQKAGAWTCDIAVQRANLEQAEAAIRQTDLLIDQCYVRAPSDGRVLQVNIREGEYAGTLSSSGPVTDPTQTTPLMIFGDISTLHVRVQVDEESAPSVRANSTAFALMRGYPTRPIPLEFIRIEPYVQIKKSLTGDNTERVDTRVLQVEYRVGPHDLPLYAGQLVDVYIRSEIREGPVSPGEPIR